MNITREELETINVPKSKDDWYTIESETIALSRNIEIVNRFEEEFNIKLNQKDDNANISYFFEIVSRNNSVREWYTKQKLIFNEVSEIPKYISENLTLDEYSITKQNLIRSKKLTVEVSTKIQELSERYQKDIKAEKEKINKFVKEGNDRFFEVLNLGVNDLPLELTIKVMNYVPSDDEDISSQKVYAREMLIQYKIFLINKLKENPDISVYDLIKIDKPL